MKFVSCWLLLLQISPSINAQLVRAVPDSMPVLGKNRQPVYERAEIMGSNQLGTVYILPQDRMPALRPDTTVTSRMPVMGSKKYRVTERLPSAPQQRFRDSILYKPGEPFKRMLLPKQGN